MILQFFFLFFLTFFPTQADLPVHCLKSQILGEWTIETSSHIQTDDGRVLCGHDSPDNAETSYKALIQLFEATNSIKVDLKDDDTVVLNDDSKENGTWTMIYDEGFEIQLKGVKYFAFSSYEFDEKMLSVSHCDKTLVGWYYVLESKEKGCYRGYKTNANNETGVTQSFKQSLSELRKFKRTTTHLTSHRSIKTTHEAILKTLKNKPKSWEAGLDPMFKEMSLFEMNRFAGRRKFASHGENKDYKHFARESVDDLPKEFDWKSLIQESVKQSHCGSCYAFSTMEMAQARLKKKYDQDVKLSVQYSINCNYYNQGCEGGYPSLVTKFGSEFQFVEESCLNYTATNGKCSDACDVSKLDKVYKVTNYYFVGGAYGKCTERLMMIELRDNGPFMVSFEPGMDFMYYKKGIYHSVLAADWIVKGKNQPDWEKVDHSVLLVGWGEEQGEKFWVVQNSWGPDWGENGLFRIRRGTDESGIESMCEAAELEMVENQKSLLHLFKKKSNLVF